MATDTERLREIIRSSRNIVFFGGAGLSTESGIPDFRSEDGVFKATQAYGYRPETLLSHTFYLRRPAVFYDYYKKYLLCPTAEPNAAHRALARMEWGSNYEKRGEGAEPVGKLHAVITQNIDDLHFRAGSKTVYELHGSVMRNRCERCGAPYGLDELLKRIGDDANGVPHCACGGRIKPDVVLYEEGLDNDLLTASVNAIAEADTLIVGGTSLNVYPAAGLCDYFNGKELVVINLSETAKQLGATLVIRRRIGEVLEETLRGMTPEELDRV
ncbi:MAG: NAD-dependent protein deacylase [Clostridia bacterium]|nr:NAD-dependent protein deacylase [Clostridia bacterium]